MLTLILSSIDMYAQNDFQDDWNSIFETVRKSGLVPDGCLWEYGLTDTGFFKWNGENEELTVDFEIWSRMYDSWRNSVMDTFVMPPERQMLMENFKRYQDQGIVVIPALFATGKRFNKSSIESGNVYLDSIDNNLKFKTANGLFKEDYIFVSSPCVHNIFQKQVRLIVSDSFLYTNTGFEVAEVQLKWNGLQYVKLELNKEFVIDLLPGQNSFSIQWTLTNGLLYKSKFILSQLELEAGFGNDQLMSPVIGDQFRNIYTEPYRKTEFEQPLGAYIEVLPGIENGVANTCIRKPIIFVEGIDFGYEDHETGCYGGKCGSMGLRDLMRGRIFHPYATKLKDMYEDWEPIKKAPNLITELRQAGYDLIYLDFHNGADYLENNAMLLVELIRRVNHVKCSKEEIVVIGASMGGLLSSFALSYMEQKDMPHCVRTYLSFDAPHKGANIPLGIQHCLLYYRKKLPGIKDAFDRKLDRAASRQMLLEHSLSENGYKEHGDRIDFMSKHEGLGKFPIKCRKVCLSNGSLRGIGQNFGSGDVLLKVNPYLGRFNFDFLEVYATVWANYANVEGKNVVLSALYPFSKKRVVMVPYDIVRYDHIAGSTRFDLQESRAIYGVFNVINKEDATCFIPTNSSMALESSRPNDDLISMIPNDRPDPLKYPFDAYYGEEYSQEHMMLTDNNIRWIMNQIESNRNELPELLLTSYNFGRIERHTIGDVRVGAGGNIKVNNSGLTGFGNGKFDRQTSQDSVYVLETADCGAHIVLEDGSSFVIGSDERYKGVFKLGKGAVLELKSGSSLIVNQFSQLIVEEGAELILHPGVKLVLDGSNAIIRLDGTLMLKENSVLSIEKVTHVTNGFIHLRAMGGGYGKARIVVEGANVSVDLNGADKKSQILQVEGRVVFGSEYPLKLFRVTQGTIRYGNNSELVVNGNCEFKKLNFSVLPWARKHAQSALYVNEFETCKAEELYFEGFKFAMLASSELDYASIEIKNCEFINCLNGLYLDNYKGSIINSRFKRMSENALVTSGAMMELVLRSTQFNACSSGIKMDNSYGSKGVMYASDLVFTSNGVGIECSNVELCLSCCQFLSNRIGIKSKATDINVSKNHVTAGLTFSEKGGNNTFYQSAGPSIQMDGGLLFLDNGYNNFIDNSSSVTPLFIKGKVAYSALTHMNNQTNNGLKAAYNYWQPLVIGGLDDASLTHYDLISIYSADDLRRCVLSGTVLNDVNTYCFQYSGCNPCGITEEPGKNIVEFGDSLVRQVLIHPYPADSKTTISVIGGKPKLIVLMTLEGKQIMTYSAVSNDAVELDLESLSDGLYLLEVVCEDRRMFKPLLVRH